MGQQQLLLIILGVIIVGIAIAVSITIFRDSGVSANRDALRTDLLLLASKAKHYYKRPVSMGGGGYSFTGLTADGVGMLKLVTSQFSDSNANGSYTIYSVAPKVIVFRGTGNIQLDDGTRPIIECTVTTIGQTMNTIQ
ncbi:MAG: hypothetical protein Q8L88_09660 [Bacteroidota bacterium]|nr:hypothetical protein [Bacteroidota bacterium]